MRRVAQLVCLLALSSCGGSDGGSQSGVPVVSGPSPTPIPSPTPTPTPAPTPAAYLTYAQLTGDQNFKTACAAVRPDYSPPLPVPVVSFGSGLTLGYTAATQTYLLTPDSRDTGLFGTQARSYGPADRDAIAPANVTVFTRTSNGFVERLAIGSNAAAGGSPDYVRGFSLRVPLFGAQTANPPAALYSCIFGVPSRSDDLPTISPVYTRGGLNGTATNYPSGAPEAYVITQSQVSFSADFAAGKVTTTIRMVGALATSSGTSSTTVDLGTYTGIGTIDRAGSFSGQLTSPDRMLRDATFAGSFFGPQASEVAYSVGLNSLDQTTGRNIVFIGNALALK